MPLAADDQQEAENNQPATAPLRLDIELDARINVAMQQNDVPVVKQLCLTNQGATPLVDLEVRLRAEPAFASPWEARIAGIAPGATQRLAPVDLVLSPDHLFAVRERTAGLLHVEVANEEPLASHQVPIELLAYNEWGGLRGLPEILAAFVLPNDPGVARMLGAAAAALREWGEDGALCGYQRRDPKYVAWMAAAVFRALQQQGLTYINPPASFEDQGQKVRPPSQLFEEGMGTCLDLAVTAAAGLEQCGLHPLLILVEGHAFAGLWLSEETFPLAAIDEATMLTNRVALGEILVFDPTLCTRGDGVDFTAARQEAERYLRDAGAFRCLIDVRRARMARIRPLPLHGESTPADRPPTADADSPAPPPAVELPADDGDDAGPGSPAGRLDHWRSKLLDLSLRNRLLNFRETRQTLPILCPDLASLEDGLAEGQEYALKPRPRELDTNDLRDPQLHRQRTGEDLEAAFLAEELAARRLHADCSPAELERRVRDIYRNARTALEESGVSGLYLALGFLKWLDEHGHERRAPLLLLPVNLNRRSVRAGFRLERGDEDTCFNTTLLELLRQDQELEIRGLDPLPEDDSGVDLPKVLRIVRRAVKDIAGWEVEESACLGIFSFTKFLMWRDLQERIGVLTRNRVVAHLVDEGTTFDPGGGFPEAETLDDEFPPTATFCPAGADSSQLAAVFAAAAGRSFVLVGPPGTGKSQTITNLVAHCLACGRTVLFVSEKMAALNVVHRRLERLGLGPFCLELHSNKANKKDVLGQFKAALDYGRRQEPDAWGREAENLARLRGDLNAYVRALHRPHRNGLSVFQAVSELVGMRDVTRLDPGWTDPEALDDAAFDGVVETVEQLAAAAGAIGAPAEHAWRHAQHADWSHRWQQHVELAIAEHAEAIDALEEALDEALVTAKLEMTIAAPADLATLVEMLGALRGCPDPSGGLLTTADWDDSCRLLDDALAATAEAQQLAATLDRDYRVRELLDMDLDDLHRRLQLAEASWPLLRWLKRQPVLRLLALAGKHGKPDPQAAADTLRDARRLAELRRDLKDADVAARELLGRRWHGEASDLDDIAVYRAWVERLRAPCRTFTHGDPDACAALREHWRQLLERTSDGWQAGRERAHVVDALETAYNSWHDETLRMVALLELDEDFVWASADAKGTLPAQVRRQLCVWAEHHLDLRDWCTWRRLREGALAADLGALVRAFESGALPAAELPRVFRRGYLEWWYGAIVDREDVLRKFSRQVHEDRIRKFIEIDERYSDLTRQLVIARLAAKLPADVEAANPNSELGRLRREIQKKTRHMPIRKLLHECQGIAQRLKPCLLMSPLSVAQYLDAEYPPFDIVVFDEASQIPVWDAVGAIARGEHAVIVGDPRQLPPTSFFTRVDDEDEPADDFVEDLESILDECLAAGLPRQHLQWHYRSRHESLIAFSNHHYYENRLLTFPAADSQDLGVSLHPVPEGVYDKGRSRSNRAEAEAVVGYVVARLLDPARRDFSIGVVTFSQAQQVLIEDLFEAARGEHPQLEAAFCDDALEPVFVKNLENVQGDERDVILFSICYGPDARGRVSMNFGPLNQEGGERRLNVAVTRARCEVHVFASLRAEDIDLARTQARGVAHLKSFLEYAARGPSVLGGEVAAATRPASPLAEQIAAALEARGHEVTRQVGCSGYRLDLAVCDPDRPGRYLLGIEGDGATYHRARAARDRDKLRRLVLEGLGWQLHRVWSGDWWLDPEREAERLDAAIAAAREATPENAENGSGANAEGKLMAPPEPPPEPPPDAGPAIELAVYAAYAGAPFGDQDSFLAAGNDKALRQSVRAVVAAEGPIHHELLLHRLADGWGLTMLARSYRDRLESQIAACNLVVTETEDGPFYWPRDAEPDACDGFRIHPDNDPDPRGIDEIALHELANAAAHVLRSQGGLPPDDLARETARLFNCQRVSKSSRERILAACERLDLG